MVRPSDEEFRARLRTLLERSGQSMRGFSSAMGRDPGYVAALLDPARPSRSRPTPEDLARASDATGILLVEFLHELWAIDPARLAAELTGLGLTDPLDRRLSRLAPAERRLVLGLIETLATAAERQAPDR
jgi:transcriptional regulator with XRE-family HTH domain